MNSHGLVDRAILMSDTVIPERPAGDPEMYDSDTRLTELIKCSRSPHYFINNYIYILDDRTRQWVSFKLYPAQANVITALTLHKYIIFLKTRQFGASTLVGGAYFLWLMLFTDNAQNLILSKSEREAHALLGDRFKPMYRKLPEWMKPAEDKSLPDSKTEFGLSNGAKMLSLPTSAGDSYTARACMVDEAALVYKSRTPLSDVLLAVEPTIAAGGQLILVSKTDKGKPNSTFNNIFVAAIKGENEFFPLFAPWQAVPWRDDEWHARKVEFSLSINGTEDYVKENYPETWQDALSPKELDKRLVSKHIKQCYDPMNKMTDEDLALRPPPMLPFLEIYRMPEQHVQYVITADAAENNPNSDYSTADVWDWDTGEQIANMCGQFEPAVFAQYIDMLGQYYFLAPVFPERNNHGHTVISWLQEMSDLRVLAGPDSSKNRQKYGYNTNSRSKAAGYVYLADMLKDGNITIHKPETYRQLMIIEGATLRAPKKEHDDHAISAMLFAAAKKYVHLEFLLDFV